MSARGQVEALLWLAVPAGTDDEAKAEARRMVDALVAEVHREAADRLAEEMGPRKMEHETGLTATFVRGYYAAVHRLHRIAEETTE